MRDPFEKRVRCLRTRLRVYVCLAAVFLFLVLSGYGFYMMIEMQQEVLRTFRQNLHLRLVEVCKDVEKAEEFLLRQKELKLEYGTLSRPQDQLQYYMAQNTIREGFTEALADYEYVDGFYLYAPGEELFLTSVQSHVTAEERMGLASGLRSLSKSYKEYSLEEKGKWIYVSVGGRSYFVKILENYRMYMGAFIKTETLEKWMGLHEIGEVHILYPREIVSEHMLILEQAEMLEFQVGVEKSQPLLGVNTVRYWLLLYFSMMGGILLLFFMQTQLRQELLDPLEHLVDLMRQPWKKQKELLALPASCQEFQMVYDSMGEMIRRIWRLDREIYEEQLHSREVTIQYLQLQINPHFLINCMNLVCSLVYMDRREDAQQAAVELGNYMRYVMRGAHWVSVEEELSLVETYIFLQKFRYEEYLEYGLELNTELKACRIPIMLIQTFVENVVKHQGSYEDVLSVMVHIFKEEQKLCVRIEDNGEGFPEEVLQKLLKKESVHNELGEHVGIQNICRRLELLYQSRAEISFYNRKDGGAGIFIRLPMEGWDSEEGDEKGSVGSV